jgi:hypothetical protein
MDRPKQDGENDKEALILDQYYAKRKRIEPLIDDINKLIEFTWEAKTILDTNAAGEVEEAHQELKSQVIDLMTAIDSYYDIELEEARSGIPYKDRDSTKKFRNIASQIGNTEEKKQMERTILKLDSALESYVRDSGKKGTKQMGDNEMKTLRDWLSRKWHQIQETVGWSTLWLSLFTIASIAAIGLLFTMSILFYSNDRLSFNSMISYIFMGAATQLALIAAIWSTAKRSIVRILVITIELFLVGMLADLFSRV